jgi:hypothetical protein
MRLKLLTLAGLCAMLVAMSNQPVRADCQPGVNHHWGYIIIQYPNYSWDSGCVYDGTVQEGFVCTNYVPGYGCIGGTVYYNCDGCS